MKRPRLTLGGLLLLYALHNDFWLWTEPRFMFGLPAGLVYHALFCFAVSGFMWLVTRGLDLDESS